MRAALERDGFATELARPYVFAKRWDRARPSEPIVFIGGCGRSGTTLLRLVLDSHPALACGPESRLLIDPMRLETSRLAERYDASPVRIDQLADESPFMPHFASAFLTGLAHENGAVIAAEKTPRNVRRVAYVLDNFDHALFVHLIRDGRDVASSLRTHPRFRVVDGRRVETGMRRPIEACVERWVDDVTQGLAWRGHDRYLEIRYEHLVLDTERALAPLLDRLGLPWDDRLLRHHEQDGPWRDPIAFPQNPEAIMPRTSRSLGRWRRDLSSDDRAAFDGPADRLLDELGYLGADPW